MCPRRPAAWPPSLLALAACGGGDAPEEPEPLELRPVVETAVEELEGRVPSPPALEPLSEEAVGELDGLVEMLTGGEQRFRELALSAVREDFGPDATPRLATILGDHGRPSEERIAATVLLASLDHPLAVERLLTALEEAPEAWLRRHAAFQLGRTSADWILPRVLKRLKYEKDQETFVWLAVTLARFRNYSGVEALFDLARSGATETLRSQARAQLDAIASEVELAPEELRRRWSSRQARTLPQPDPSLPLRLEVWRVVASMSDDTIQLRGVDDARFVLSRLGPWAAPELARALAEEDLHLRLHVAQVLERMGARAHEAGPLLLEALRDPLLAPNAAEALGSVGHPPAREALEGRTGPDEPHELRVACVRALGRLGLSESIPVVRSRFEDTAEPLDLRMAAATALVLLGEGDAVAGWLHERLTGESGDPPAAELALETWLVRGAERGRSGFEAALEAWRGAAGPPGVTPTLEEMRERRARRAKTLDPAALVGAG